MKAPKMRRPESLYNPYWDPPDKEWLEDQLCVQKKSVEIVADEVGANRKTVENWIAEVGVTYWGQYRKVTPKGMKAPYREVSLGGRVTWHPPSKAWLEYQHSKLEKSVNKIAEELGTTHDVVFRWLGNAKVKRVRRYPKGPKSASWKEEGHSRPRSHARKVLNWKEVPEKCTWCGTVEQVQAHHKDHNPHNNKPNNLMWLCYDCNLLEAHIWRLLKQGKIDLECDGQERTMVIKFKK